MDCSPPDSSVHEDSPGKNAVVGCHAFLQGIFPTQGLNQVNPHCRSILYHLSHQGSSRILEWSTYPFSRGSSQLRNPTWVFCIAGGFFTNWATREAHFIHNSLKQKFIDTKYKSFPSENTEWTHFSQWIFLEFNLLLISSCWSIGSQLLWLFQKRMQKQFDL